MEKLKLVMGLTSDSEKTLSPVQQN